MSEADGHGKGRTLPRLSPEGEARRSQRETRLAKALRANLRRRKADLDSRGGADAAPGRSSAAQPGPGSVHDDAAPRLSNPEPPPGDEDR